MCVCVLCLCLCWLCLGVKENKNHFEHESNSLLIRIARNIRLVIDYVYVGKKEEEIIFALSGFLEN